MRLMLTRPLNSLMRPDIAAVLLDAGLDLALKSLHDGTHY
jgi:hypothetical protein